jgi:3-methyladenine DNA glycosylase Mpg
VNKLIAEKNKVFKNIVTGEIVGTEIYLAKSDKASNYIQVLSEE